MTANHLKSQFIFVALGSNGLGLLLTECKTVMYRWFASAKLPRLVDNHCSEHANHPLHF